MKQGDSLCVNSRSTTLGTHRPLWTPKRLLSCSQGSPMEPTLSHTDLSIFVVLSLLPSLNHPIGLFPSDFEIKIPY
jgi:hypothetical protein